MIHFPNGPRPIPVVPDLAADLLRAVARVPNAPQQSSATPGDTVSVRSMPAALELDLMNHSDPNTAPAGAADYQLARTAASASETVTSLQHLEQAVQQSPAYGAVALEDPAFHAMRGPVQELVDRMQPVAGTGSTAAAGTYQPPRGVPQSVVPASETPDSQSPVVTNSAPVVEAGQDPAPKSTNTPPALTSSAPPASMPAQPDVDRDAPPALPPPSLPVRSPALPSQPPMAAQEIPRAVSAAMDLDFLQSWDTEPARALAANEYQLAQTAMQSGDRSAALQHLEQAILAHPAQAAAALADLAFDSIRGSVRDLVTRLTLAERIHAEASISEAHAALQSLGISAAARPLLLARAYLQSAQSSLQLGTYTGYVQAALAADLAQRAARGKLRSRRWGFGAFTPMKQAIERTVRRLWQRLPGLAILLGWFFAGVVAAVASLPFEAGAAFRAWLLPLWSIGLVCFVLYGFVRSIRATTRRRH